MSGWRGVERECLGLGEVGRGLEKLKDLRGVKRGRKKVFGLG